MAVKINEMNMPKKCYDCKLLCHYPDGNGGHILYCAVTKLSVDEKRAKQGIVNPCYLENCK